MSAWRQWVVDRMEGLGQEARRSTWRTLTVMVAALVISTVVVAVLENVLLVHYAASFYLIGILVVALMAGTAPAIATAIASAFLYDFFFTAPYFTLTVADPQELLNLLLFVAVGMVISRLVALQAARTIEAAERAREALALFRISRSLATSEDLAGATSTVLAELATSTAMDRIWLGLGPTPTLERIIADTAAGAPLPASTWQIILQRRQGDEPARWQRSHVAAVAAAAAGRIRGRQGNMLYRVRLEVSGDVLGSLWGLRSRNEKVPDRAETRIFSAAADQLAQGVHRERLASEAVEAEIARRSDALKTALLDSVSHDLRTPLATIRAAAGSMLDPEVAWTTSERNDALRSIDAEAERMNRLVRNLLDLSRIEGGALRPEIEAHDLDELLGPVVKRIPMTETLRLDIPDDLPPLLVDDTYFDEVMTNLLENAVHYGGPNIRISAAPVPSQPMVEITVEDDGQGVADADLSHLFEKFYRVRRAREASRRGMGIGLTVAQGLVRAMGGDIHAGRSGLGGLAVRIVLPSTGNPPESPDSPPTVPAVTAAPSGAAS